MTDKTEEKEEALLIEEEEPETPVEDKSAREVAEGLEGFKDYQKENKNSLTFGDY